MPIQLLEVTTTAKSKRVLTSSSISGTVIEVITNENTFRKDANYKVTITKIN